MPGSRLLMCGVLVSSLAACGGGTPVRNSTNTPSGPAGGSSTISPGNLNDAEKTHSRGGTSWTVLVYMIADNDLEPFALLDLQEMMRVGSSGGFTIIAEVDRAAGYSADGIGGLPDWTTAKRLRVDTGKLTELDDLGELDMGDPKNLSDFLSWGISSFPADNVAVVFWDHGSAWPGFGADMSANWDGLTLSELTTAMTNGLTAAKRDRVQLVGFDACLMGSLEVALVMRDYAEYLVASEELEPGHGWDYSALSQVKARPALAPTDVASVILNGFHGQAVTEGDSASITLSTVDLYTLKAIEHALVDLKAAFDADTSLVTTFGRARGAALEFGKQATADASAEMVDLGDVADAIAVSSSTASSPAAHLRSALDASVLSQTTGQATAAATGIAVYWPAYRGLYDADYDKVPAIANWRALLNDVQSATTGGPSTPAFVSANASEVKRGTFYEISNDLNPDGAADVVQAGLYYGLQVDSRYFVLGDQFATVNASTVIADWDGTVLVVSQGALEDYGYFSYQYGEGGTTIGTIPFGYAAYTGAALQTALLSIVYDANGQVTQETFYLSTSAGYGQLTPATGSKLYPVYAELKNGSLVWSATTTAFDATQSFDLTLQPLSTSASNRQAFGILYVANYAGASATSMWSGDL